MKTHIRDIVLAAALITVAVLGRAIPHAANATPVAAAALFAGVFLQSRWLALSVPLLALGISDALFRGAYDPRVMVAVYAAMTVPVLLRPWLRDRRGPLRIAGCSLVGSLVFFLVTNFAVWASGWGYTPNVAGLLHCYANGLPFLRATIVGDLTWCMVLFGAAAAVELLAARPVGPCTTETPALAAR